MTAVCLIPWKRLCETKEVMSMYENVVKWDDSGAREAFENAKARFWAEINGRRTDIVLPGPDLFIDKVDDYAVVDPELIADLEKPASSMSRGGAVTGWDSVDRPVSASGWDEDGWGERAEHWGEDPVVENFKKTANQSYMYSDRRGDEQVMATGWDDEGYSAPQDNTAAQHQFESWGRDNDANNGWKYGSGKNASPQNNTSADPQTESWGREHVANNEWNYGSGKYSAPQNYAPVDPQTESWGKEHDVNNGWNYGGGNYSSTLNNTPAEPQPESWGREHDANNRWNYGSRKYSTPQNNAPAEPQFESWGREHDANNGWNYGSGNYYGDSGNAWGSGEGWGHDNVQNNSWGGGQDNYSGNQQNNTRGSWENKNNSYSRRNGRKRDGGQYGNRSTRSRYPPDNYQMNNGWNDNRGSNRPYQNPAYDKQPLAMR